jgi:uncharacterized protein YbbC (DUF1343 family)
MAKSISVLFLLALGHSSDGDGTRLPTDRPEAVGMNAGRLEEIGRLVDEGLRARRMPGCVVLVARRGKIVFHQAYGQRQVEPERVPMTTDTVFDLASLTKPIVTATCVMLLMEDGKLRLEDPVAKHLPEFAQNGKQDVTLYDLLTHQGGLIPDNALRDYENGPSHAWERMFAQKLAAEPGTKFVYSDLGYIMLAEVVRRVSGKDVHEFSQERVFRPLGMTDTGYLPAKPLRRRAAPTERQGDRWLQGEVHDPRAARLGSIAGHAGLFSTAADLAVYAQMLLNGGRAGPRILSEPTVALMTAGYPVPGGLRGLGWDVKTGFSSNRGEAFTARAFGHGGFTGTGLWIDPALELFVIFLSNRLHPDGQGKVNPLIGSIGTVAANAIDDKPPPTVLLGIDVLQQSDFRDLAGRRLGLITNHTGVNRFGHSTAQLLRSAENVQLVALFSPEHGLAGKLDVSHIADMRDEATGLPVYSLYGETRRPTAKMLEGLDTLVFDIQDIGARFYTYISTMGLAMQAAAERRLRFVVLDRPNPLGGLEVSGPMLDAGRESFVAFHRLPVQHGLTIGELARLFNAEMRIGADLQVIRLDGWRRRDTFAATGLTWINPSPNMRSPTEALLYPGIGLLETTNLSVGRGTEIPFEVLGAPWLDGVQLARRLNAERLPGLRCVPIRFTPVASKFAGQRCGGVRFLLIDRPAYQSVRTGLYVARQLRQLHPQHWRVEAYDQLLGNRQVLQAVLDGRTIAEIETLYEPDVAAFRERRTQFLLYD